MRARVSWMVVPVLVFAACGGGDDDSQASAADWCDLAQRIDESGASFDALESDDPAEVEALVAELQGLFDEAARVAPEEILADVNTSADTVDAFAELVQGSDFDVTGIDEASLAELGRLSLDMAGAVQRIEAYNERECGIAPSVTEDAGSIGDGTTPTTESAGSTTEPGGGGAASGDPNSEWCVAARDVEAASDALDALDFTDPQAVEEGLTRMVDEFEAALPFAPDELRDDLAITFDSFLQLREALVAVDYDFINADLSALDDPDGTIDAATKRIEQYNEDVCGIVADPTGTSGTDPSFDPTAGTIRDQAVAELVRQGFTEDEAACIFDNLDFTDPQLGDDLGAIVDVFDLCGIDLDRLAELGG